MRSLDDCKVTVRSHKADFLSGIERRECVELIRVARYFMSGSDIACFTFVTNCLGLQFVQIALFVRMRSLDDCKVTVRSHKADFLSENER